ncbi:hypothetical protein BGX26_004667 [Mortierella sp. AD094]|nr:hypothetical protein BGX26_004667 [Mortierella sp. AD094]
MRDWMAVEGAKDWDEFAKKYLSERSWKIGHELHDIFVGRMRELEETQTSDLSIYGIIFGGATILLHVLRWVKGSVTCLRQYQSLSLTPDISDFDTNLEILKFLLLLKKKVMRAQKLAARSWMLRTSLIAHLPPSIKAAGLL